MKKLVFLIALLVSFNCFSQDQFKLGDVINYKKNNIIFSFKKPIPFQESQQSYSADNDNLVVSFLNQENMTIIQIYSTLVPSKFYLDVDQFFSNEKGVENFMNQIFPKPINKINSYRVIKIGSQSFLEVSLISHNIQKQTNWITFYKNNMVNILGTTTISNFSNIEAFLYKFKESIRIK